MAYPFETHHTQHLFYTDNDYANPHIHELSWDSSGWHTEDLTAATGAPQSGGGNLVGYAFEAQGTLHLFYIAGNRAQGRWLLRPTQVPGRDLHRRTGRHRAEHGQR